MKILVASANPAKIKSVADGLTKLGHIEVIGQEAVSGVSSQPRSDEETRQGAQNRVKNAWAEIMAAQNEAEIDLVIGLEGGVFEPNSGQENEMWSTVWVVLTDKDGQTFEVNGCRFVLPVWVAAQIRGGKEMGQVIGDKLGDPDAHKKLGLIGEITKGYTSRPQAYTDLVTLAVGLWYGATDLKKYGIS